jgi:hypothetical protein
MELVESRPHARHEGRWPGRPCRRLVPCACPPGIPRLGRPRPRLRSHHPPTGEAAHLVLRACPPEGRAVRVLAVEAAQQALREGAEELGIDGETMDANREVAAAASPRRTGV